MTNREFGTEISGERIQLSELGKSAIMQTLYFGLAFLTASASSQQYFSPLGIAFACGALAFAGLSLTPEIAALAMSFSSVCVVTSALTINLFKPKRIAQNVTKSEINEVKTEKTEFEIKEKNTMTAITVKVEGMMCPRCEKHVCDALKKIDGVVDATASCESGTATVSTNKEVSESIIKAAIIDAGYEA